MKNAFEGFQNLNFPFFIKFDVPLRNEKLGLYYLQEKKCIFLDTQNMESKSGTWIDFSIKVRFLGLWKTSLFLKFDENIHDLYYWENQYFWFNIKFD